jgi:hypothetical protein
LDGVAVAVESGEEPGVFCADEFAGELVGPELFMSVQFSTFRPEWT